MLTARLLEVGTVGKGGSPPRRLPEPAGTRRVVLNNLYRPWCCWPDTRSGLSPPSRARLTESVKDRDPCCAADIDGAFR